MIEHLYRFRPLHWLLEENELRNQEIYFAEPGQLNDPMEGFRDVFWKGDDVVWRNFFRHYLICLDNAFGQWILCDDTKHLGWTHIPVFNHGDLNDGIPHKALEEELLGSFFSEPSIQRLIKALSANSFSIRRDELTAHLIGVHFLALDLIRRAYVRRGLYREMSEAGSSVVEARRIVEQTVDCIDQIQSLSQRMPIQDIQVDGVYSSRRRIEAQLHLINVYNKRIDASSWNRNFILLSFPEGYVKEIESLVYPEWYAACFMRGSRNSAIWGSYGQNHKAVCLKFRVTETDHKPGLRIRRQVGISTDGPVIDFTDHPFKAVSYENDHLPVDFFRSLGRFPIPVLRKHWYSDEIGNRSICGEEIFRADEEWRKRYWDAFDHAITRKLRDWSHEEEYRLILHNYFFDYRDPAKRKLTYRFADLSGVIFGINTPLEAKLEICKIIEEKCRQEKRADFKFYQAFYSRSTGAIEHYENSLLKFTT